jgi:FKBP-type peptidyl-prolyl cis-trans isomerase FkpA
MFIYKKQADLLEKELVKNKTQVDMDSKTIEEYLAKNNIKAQKGKWGTYVQIKTEGAGNAITKDDVVSVKYTGKTFDSSRVFDSNTDPKFNHLEDLPVNMGQLNGIIPGWIDGISLLKKGSVATFYVPSSLGYGAQGNPGPGIKPNAILVFDINITNVENEEAAMKAAQEKQAMMQQMQQQMQQQAQQKMMDSMSKSAPKK